MKTLLAFELKKSQKTIMILSLVSGFMVMFSMFFYKSIAENMAVLSGFLSTGVMQGIMSAFNVDVFAMRTLNGFFATYSTMWIVLMGSVFFGYFGSELLAKEEKMGSIEFLLSKPIKRQHIFISKLLSLLIASFVFMVIVGLLGYVSILLEMKYAPYEINMSMYTPLINEKIVSSSEALKPFVKFTEEDFKAFTTGMLTKQYKENKAEIENQGIDAEHILNVLEPHMDDPEALFNKMMLEPGEYMTLLHIEGISEAEFIKNLSDELSQYKAMKAVFLESDAPLETLFAYDPAFFINYWINHKTIDEVNVILDYQMTKTRLISRFDYVVFVKLLFNMFIIIFANGVLGFIIAATSKDAQTSSQRAMIIILILYFLNSIGGISEITKVLTYFTPFGYIETDITTYYTLNYKPLVLTVFMAFLSTFAYRYYQTKNFN